MKIAARILSVIVLTSLASFYIGCGGDPKPKKSETDEQIEKLNGTWVVTEAMFEGVPPELNHTGMTLTINGVVGNQQLSFTVAGRPTGPSAWPSSGAFTFLSTDIKSKLMRDDDILVTYTVTDGTLTMDFDFNIDPYTAGRTSSVDGQWHFAFNKQ